MRSVCDGGKERERWFESKRWTIGMRPMRPLPGSSVECAAIMLSQAQLYSSLRRKRKTGDREFLYDRIPKPDTVVIEYKRL